MSWLKIDDLFDTHPKLLGLRTDDRRWTWVRILIYTSRHQSPTVPQNIRDAVAKATPAFVQDCVNLGLIDVSEDNTMTVHDWHKYQAGDPQRAARQKRWRDKHVAARVDTDVDTYVVTAVDATRVGARPRPVPEPQEQDLNQKPKAVPRTEQCASRNDDDHANVRALIDRAAEAWGTP